MRTWLYIITESMNESPKDISFVSFVSFVNKLPFIAQFSEPCPNFQR
jgi:hypothetical protein